MVGVKGPLSVKMNDGVVAVGLNTPRALLKMRGAGIGLGKEKVKKEGRTPPCCVLVFVC